MGLELKTIRTRGRAERVPVVLSTRALDLAEVEAHRAREAGIEASPLQRLTARHRELAKKIALGWSTSQCAAYFGFTASRVSVIKADPTFRDLVSYFQMQGDDSHEFYQDNLKRASLQAVLELQDRLETAPEEFDNQELMKLMALTADRTGHAPKRVEEKNINVNFGERLEEARTRARQMVIESTAIDLTETIEDE